MKFYLRGNKLGFIFALLIVLLFGSNGCSRVWEKNIALRNIEDPIDVVEEKVGLIGESQNTFVHLRNVQPFIPIIKFYAQRYNIDWVLIVAMMKQESVFNEDAVSHRGAYGLMQLMPLTQIEVAERLKLHETESPQNNIHAGVYYFQSLYSNIQGKTENDRIRIALAAYNAGLGRVQDAQAIAGYLGEDPTTWNAVRLGLTLLTKQNYTLHQRVWDAKCPPSGYFSDWKQTHSYVEKIMKDYNNYSLALR